MSKFVLAIATGVSLGLLSSCSGDDAAASEQSGQTEQAADPSSANPAARTSMRPAPTEEALGQIIDLSATDGFWLGGQPEPSDFEDMKIEGVKTVIDLRLPSETRDFDEPGAAIAAGLDYVPLGFSSGSLNDEILNQALSIMRDETRQPMLVHCDSATRVGAVWMAFRVLEDGLSEEAALAEAKSVGLRSTAMEETVKDYVRRMKESKDK